MSYGRMEQWNGGMMGKTEEFFIRCYILFAHYSIIPIFQS
jgi:hypothetical protein